MVSFRGLRNYSQLITLSLPKQYKWQKLGESFISNFARHAKKQRKYDEQVQTITLSDDETIPIILTLIDVILMTSPYKNYWRGARTTHPLAPLLQTSKIYVFLEIGTEINIVILISKIMLPRSRNNYRIKLKRVLAQLCWLIFSHHL